MTRPPYQRRRVVLGGVKTVVRAPYPFSSFAENVTEGSIIATYMVPSDGTVKSIAVNIEGLDAQRAKLIFEANSSGQKTVREFSVKEGMNVLEDVMPVKAKDILTVRYGVPTVKEGQSGSVAKIWFCFVFSMGVDEDAG